LINLSDEEAVPFISIWFLSRKNYPTEKVGCGAWKKHKRTYLFKYKLISSALSIFPIPICERNNVI
jgi:hypothetical protein